MFNLNFSVIEIHNCRDFLPFPLLDTVEHISNLISSVPLKLRTAEGRRVGAVCTNLQHFPANDSLSRSISLATPFNYHLRTGNNLIQCKQMRWAHTVRCFCVYPFAEWPSGERPPRPLYISQIVCGVSECIQITHRWWQRRCAPANRHSHFCSSEILDRKQISALTAGIRSARPRLYLDVPNCLMTVEFQRIVR